MRTWVLSAACLLALIAVATALPRPAEDKAQDTAASAASDAARPKRTIGFLRSYFPTITDEAVAKSRVARAVAAAEDLTPAASETTKDQDAAASEDDEGRDKRFLFSFGRQSEEGGQGSAGGSGNFLFDIIRDTASRTARAAGGFYRMVAGTGESPAEIKYSPWLKNKHEEDDDEPEGAASGISLGLGLGVSGKASLIAGSGASEDDHGVSTGPSGSGFGLGHGYSTGAAAAIAEAPEVDAKEDGYTSGIPGPITRLFVIANRGVSNLIQDLILRLAQTSERIVNFKARLITSII